MDFAIIKTGGKQYKVKKGDIIRIERIRSEKKKLEFEDIFGGKKVMATILAQGKYPKKRILKFKPKKRYLRIKGHRQPFTQIKIESIQ